MLLATFMVVSFLFDYQITTIIMKKITHRFDNALTSAVKFLVVGALSFGVLTPAFALTQISSQLDPGESNADVTSLQQFLSAYPTWYPSAIVNGTFDAATQAAVIRFQAAYGLAQVGRVGPQTRDKLNQLIGGIGPVVTSATGPTMYMPYLPVITNTTATFTWLTSNQAALGRVYYSTSPLQMNEGDINSNGFAVTTGQLGSYDGVARTQQSSVLSGLQPNTSYYYTIVATDLGGNVSVIGPNNTFRTNP